ncbi:hypothetical protein F2P81_000571 [Scophthalmus maximus]|uniref:Uncharacterized protein n=1 Tax=Scophthalmus maximus TaxID=52904 RepID=A0A6A4TRE5_SCOMX|nr:hypothetical protein F2P81_000571 [Scophthalmus maximus]
MRNDDTVQVSGVVRRVAEEVQTVAWPVIADLGREQTHANVSKWRISHGPETLEQMRSAKLRSAKLIALQQQETEKKKKKKRSAKLIAQQQQEKEKKKKLVPARTSQLLSAAVGYTALHFSSYYITTIPPLLPSDWTVLSAMLSSARTARALVPGGSGGMSEEELAPRDEGRSIVSW